ncbi:MAG: surface lipoprotein assembly modifier [Sphingomicrobium sp.]
MKRLMPGGATATGRTRQGTGGHRTAEWTAALLGIAAIAQPVAAATGPPITRGGSVQSVSWDEYVRQLMVEGKLESAKAVLNARLSRHPKDVQARFLKGMIAVAAKDNREAIRVFRSILIDHPDAARVRLELARAFYLAKDYGNAKRQFQFALAGNLPREVAANINTYLAAIRDAKSLSYNFGIALAPDTNLNTGSSAREVTLFGLPFDLSEDARQRSGVGIAIEAGAEWAPRIGTGKRLRLGISGQRREYSGSNFDDMTAAAYVGPRWVSGKWDLSLLGTAYKRWYGTRPNNQAAGGRLEATYYLTPRLGISSALAAQWVRFSRARERDGRLISFNATAFRAMTSSSAITLKVGVGRQQARITPYANWNGFVAAGYFRDLPKGFSVYVEPSLSLARYDAALLGFGKRRSDNSQSVLITLLNRHVVLGRFTPRISYTFTRQSSTIPLYAFSRSRLEIGFTTVF